MATLELDHQTHKYTIGGRRVGGVNEILQALGIINARWFTPESRERGSAVHLACEYLLQGRLDWATVDESIKGYVDAAAKFVTDAGIVIGHPDNRIECPVYHPQLHYAGMPDFSGKAFGDECVIDHKTGLVGQAGLATAAYEMALRAEDGSRMPRRRFAVQYKNNGKYKLTPLTDSRDYVLWQSCVMVFNTFHIHHKDNNDRTKEQAHGLDAE